MPARQTQAHDTITAAFPSDGSAAESEPRKCGGGGGALLPSDEGTEALSSSSHSEERRSASAAASVEVGGGQAGGGGGAAAHSNGRGAVGSSNGGMGRAESIPSPFQQMIDVPFRANGNGRWAPQSSASIASTSSTAIAVGLAGLKPAGNSPGREARELLRSLDEVLQPRHSIAAKLYDVMQATEQLMLELQLPEDAEEEEGAYVTWSERQEYLRQLQEFQQRREKLSTAAGYGSMTHASGSDVAMLRAVLAKIDEVSCDLGRLIRDAGASMGAALRKLVELKSRPLQSSALELAQKLVDLTCAEIRCRSNDQHAASTFGLKLFTLEQTRYMAAGAYDIADGAIVGGRGLQMRIIQVELSQKGTTFHGLSDVCRDLQDIWSRCSELVAGTDEVASYCWGTDMLGSDRRYQALVGSVVIMALEGIDLVAGALGEPPLGMVVVEDDLLMQYWMPEALTGLQRLVEEAQLRVVSLTESRRLSGSMATEAIEWVYEATQLPVKLYSLVLAVVTHVKDIGSEHSLWFRSIMMTAPNLWCDEDVGALRSLEDFATKILAFLKTLFYGGNSEQNHLEACSKVDDQLMSRIVLAAKGCCTLVVEIRKRLSNYEAIGASGGLSSPTRESNNSFVESDYSTPESLSMRSGSAVASGTMYGGGVEGGEVEDGDSVISVRVESVSGKQLVDSAAVAVAVSEARIPTVTARELKIDKSNLAGEGSFGKVYPGSYYRAKVAVKVLNASRELFQSPRFWENFNTEWAACQLSHPNIVRFIATLWLHDVMGSRFAARDERELCIVMEWCGYGDLHRLIKTARAIRDAKHERRAEPFPDKGDESRFRWAAKFFQMWDVRLELACQIAAGMAFIHCSSYLHRDLKSSNILLAIGWTRGNAGNDIEYLQAKVADFDGARKLKEGCSKLQSDTYLSILYQAPETLLCQEVGKPADVFSFGVLLWELITLIEPWEEKMAQHGKSGYNYILYNVPNGERLGWPDPLACEPRLHTRKRLMRLVEACWSPAPASRPTMEDLLTSLSEIREEEKQKSRAFFLKRQQQQRQHDPRGQPPIPHAAPAPTRR